jgi:N-methylhydantoinase A
MHACELALDLGIRHIVLPRDPGLLCAWGALGAPLGRELSLTIREVAPSFKILERRARPMLARAQSDLRAEGVAASAIHYELWADLRYRGQSYELAVKLSPRYAEEFHRAHQRTFGYAAPDAPVEVVNLRLRASAAGPSIAPARLPRRARPAPSGHIQTIVGRVVRNVPIYDRDQLGSATRLAGPMILTELSATTYVAPEFNLRVDQYGNLHLEQR